MRSGKPPKTKPNKQTNKTKQKQNKQTNKTKQKQNKNKTNKLPITGHENTSSPQKKREVISLLVSFFIVFSRLTVKCRFVASQRGLPRKCADCVVVS